VAWGKKEIEKAIRDHKTIYIRWSRSPRQDQKRGFSLDHGSGCREAGLSVMPIGLSDLERGETELAFFILDYSFAGPICSVWTGEVVGHGKDGEPLLGSPKLLGTISHSYLAKLWDIRNRARGTNTLNPWKR